MKDHCRSGYRFTIPNHRQQWQVSYKWFPKVLVLPLLWVKKEKIQHKWKQLLYRKKKSMCLCLHVPQLYLFQVLGWLFLQLKYFICLSSLSMPKKNEWWLTYMYNLKIKTTYSEKRVKYKRSSFFQIKILKARLLFCVFNHISLSRIAYICIQKV